jgi:aspartate/methionine/tyrosine aminotransferase
MNKMALTKENKFLNTPSQLQGDEKLVIINTPNNPTASVMGIELLCEWVESAIKNNFVILSDECYSELYFDEKPASILEACKKVGNENFKNVLVINSISKRSSAPSLRSGYIAGDKEILKNYLAYRTYVGCATPLPLQKTAMVAWSEDSHVEKFRESYRKNFKIAEEILGIKKPKGTFYIWLEVGDDIEFTKKLWTKGVKVMPGSFMGRDGMGKGYIRIALVYDEESTKKALEIIKGEL